MGQPADESTRLNRSEGNIIYQATYTRARGSEAEKFQRLLREAQMPDGVNDNRGKP